MSIDQPLLAAANKIVERMGGEESVLAEYDDACVKLAASPPSQSLGGEFRELMAGSELAFTRLGDIGALQAYEQPDNNGGRYLQGVWGLGLCNLGLLSATGIEEMREESFSAVPAYVIVEMLSASVYFGLREEAVSISSWVEQLGVNQIAMAASEEEEDCWNICRFIADSVINNRAEIEVLPEMYRVALSDALNAGTTELLAELISTREGLAVQGLRYDRPPFHAVSYALIPIEVFALLSLLDKDERVDWRALRKQFPAISERDASREAALAGDSKGLQRLREIAQQHGFFKPMGAVAN